MKYKYITNISDYDMNIMEEVFYVLNRNKIENDILSEEIIAKPNIKLVSTDNLPLDSKFFWKL